MPPPQDLFERLRRAGQAHVLAHWDTLDPEGADRFAAELAALDLDEVGRLRELLEPGPVDDATGLEPLPQVVRGADRDADAKAGTVGRELLRQGRVAAFVVAGGQGTRLGHAGPKGTFPATPISAKPLFRVFAEKLRARARAAGRPIPWYVMTSPENHEETLAFFEASKWFGLERSHLSFFQQGTMPALDSSGRLILGSRGTLFRSPDGHGGSLRALARSGALADMAARGVEEIFYFQVDNPLVDLCDPVFLGHHRLSGSDFSSKAVPKRDPDEKVGVLVARDGTPGVIEYSDLPAPLREARNEDGQLRFRAGNVAIHAISRGFVEELTRGVFQLPFHLARKDIPSVDAQGAPAQVKGIKFETFVFDALPLTRRTLVMEVRREDEFSPIKNREGQDSPETSRRDQSALYASWLEALGFEVPRRSDGYPRHRIEISPLFANEPSELQRRRRDVGDLDGDLLLEAR